MRRICALFSTTVEELKSADNRSESSFSWLQTKLNVLYKRNCFPNLFSVSVEDSLPLLFLILWQTTNSPHLNLNKFYPAPLDVLIVVERSFFCPDSSKGQCGKRKFHQLGL